MARRRPEPAPVTPLTPSPSSEFKRDIERLMKQGKQTDKLVAIIETLCARQQLEVRHRDHALVGNWQGARECHIESDWLLIYREEEGGQLALVRSGSHSELFKT